MSFKNSVAFLFLLLSGCGVSGFVHNEYVTFSPEGRDELFHRKIFQSNDGFFWKIFTDKSEQYVGETRELVKDNVVFEFAHNEGGFAGAFPFVPPPPFMPVFLNDTSLVCPVSTDLKMTVRVIDEKSVLGEDKEIQEYLKQPDISKIYLLKDNGAVVLPRHFWNDGYAYQICFPVTAEETDNAVLVVDGVFTQQNKKIQLEPQRLRYYDEYALGMGYLSSFVRCEFNAIDTMQEE